MSFTNFDPVVAAACQDGILVPGFQQNLKGIRAYSNFTKKHRIAANTGIKQTFTQNVSRPITDLTPRAGSDVDTNLDNGMVANKSGIEQHEITLNEWDGFGKVDIGTDEALIASNLIRELANLGEEAYNKKELLIRLAYLDKYMGGNSRVITGGTTSTTQVHVDDIRGFEELLTATGELKDVSGSNTLLVDEINAAGNLVQTLTVTGAVRDVSNVSSVAAMFVGGVSGQLTFNTATAPTVGNALVARNAPRMLRAGSRVHSGLIGRGDIGTLDGPSAIATYLRNQGVRGIRGGIYCVCGFSLLEQLKVDPRFQSAYNGRGNDPDIADGLITEFDGIRYLPSNFVPRSVNADGTIVERALFIGSDEACLEADWEGFDNFIAKKKASANSFHHYEQVESNMAIFLPTPNDAKGRIQKFGYSYISGFSCGTDMNAKNSVFTASDSLYKKAAIYEYAVAS